MTGIFTEQIKILEDTFWSDGRINQLRGQIEQNLLESLLGQNEQFIEGLRLDIDGVKASNIAA